MDGETITALGVIIVALTGAFTAWNQRKIHQELKTMNAGTVGSFAADDETRRVEAIPHDERTPTEQTHLDEAPPKEAAQGPRPTVAERTEAIYAAVNGKPSDQPTLYDMVQTIDIKVDSLVDRFDRLEDYVGAPHEPPPVA